MSPRRTRTVSVPTLVLALCVVKKRKRENVWLIKWSEEVEALEKKAKELTGAQK